MSWQILGRRKLWSVTCQLDSNVPAIVTPDIGVVSVGLIPKGNEVLLNQEVLDPESRRIRSGLLNCVFCSDRARANVNGIISSEIVGSKDFLVAGSQES